MYKIVKDQNFEIVNWYDGEREFIAKTSCGLNCLVIVFIEDETPSQRDCVILLDDSLDNFKQYYNKEITLLHLLKCVKTVAIGFYNFYAIDININVNILGEAAIKELLEYDNHLGFYIGSYYPKVLM